MRGLFLALVIGILGWNDLTAQTWEEIPTPSHSKSVVKIMGNDGVSGSGTVVKKLYDSKKHQGYYMGLVVTASHCVDNMGVLFEIQFYNGAITNNATPIKDLNITLDADNDLAVLRALIPLDVPVTELSSATPKCNEEVLLSGYGAGKVRHWAGKYCGKKLTTQGHIVFTWAIQGDSGGPVIHDGKLIGVICYGSGIKRYNETKRMIVGPVYASNISRIKEFIDGYTEKM